MGSIPMTRGDIVLVELEGEQATTRYVERLDAALRLHLALG